MARINLQSWDGIISNTRRILNVMFTELYSRISILETNKRAELEVNGYTMLGSDAPSIKMKKLTGTTPAEGASVTIVHGLDKSKIIGAQVLVNNDTGNRIPPNFTSVVNHEFDFFIDTTNVHIYCIAANSANINGNAVTVLITYEE